MASKITTRPHPFNSRANDAVRSFILSRLNEIDSDSRTALTVHNDIYSNVTWHEGRVAQYFEGNNILVKIQGRNPELKSVLFSAHYDSVSTAYGATDDGMGVVTLLQLITYFSKNTPSRSVVFNINNGEEDGLHGSHAFLNHPLSKEIGFFLNLEGAGAGGVPIVFRTSSYEVTQALKTTSHPHGSVFSSDTFALGLIRSRTDYSVYTAAGMYGLDFAFYQRRSYYHTMRDTISNLNGPRSLWLFMDSSLSIGCALAQIDSSGTEQKLPLHFDRIGGLYLITFFYGASLLTLVIFFLGRYSSKESAAPVLDTAESDLNDQNETTPLLPREQMQPYETETGYLQTSMHIWMVLLCVPIPVILTTQIAVVLLHALSQTLPDGSSSAFGEHELLSVDLYRTPICRSLFGDRSARVPTRSPLNAFHVADTSVNLTEQSSEVQLTGVEGHIQKIVSQMPSAWHNPVLCEADALPRLTRCKWNSTTAITKDMVSLDTEVIRSGEATFRVRGQNTRFCRIRFDRPVLAFHVNGSAEEIQHGYSFPSNGTTELQLWSRERSKSFAVDVSWPRNETLQGRVSCGWSDSEDWEDYIPAFKEILDFLPSWSVVSKREHGLVEASLEFSL